VPLRDCLKHAFMNPTLPTLLWQPAACASYWQGSHVTSNAHTLVAKLAQHLRATAAGAAGAGVRLWTLDAGRRWILGAGLCVSGRLSPKQRHFIWRRHPSTTDPNCNDWDKLQHSALCVRGLGFASPGRIGVGSRCARDTGLGGTALSRTLWFASLLVCAADYAGVSSPR